MRFKHGGKALSALAELRFPTYMQCNKFSRLWVPLLQCLIIYSEKDRAMLTISTLKNNFRRWARIRNTIRELSSLTDRDLNDLGISRSDIRFVAKRSVAR